MRIRSTLLLLTPALVSTFNIAACARDAVAPIAGIADSEVTLEQQINSLRADYGWIGDYHTDGLAFVYGKLKENSVKTKKEPTCKVAARALKEFHRSLGKGTIPATLVDPSLTAETCGEAESDRPISKSILAGASTLRMNELSPEATKYINRITNAIEYATSRDELIYQLRSIESAAVSSLPELEAGAVVGVVAITISSMDYWEQNLDSWIALDTSAPYSRLAAAGGESLSRAGSPPRWWSHPAVRAYLKIVGADATAGARVLYTTWAVGPIGWDAAAAAGVWGSALATIILFTT